MADRQELSAYFYKRNGGKHYGNDEGKSFREFKKDDRKPI